MCLSVCMRVSVYLSVSKGVGLSVLSVVREAEGGHERRNSGWETKERVLCASLKP